MVVILTEDTKTGYNFMCLLKKNIFQSPVEIYNTAYKDPSGTGSYSKIYQAVLNLIEDKKISKGDIVFIMYDNIIPVDTKPGMVEDQRALNKNISMATSKLRRMGVQYYTSTHTCIEEVFISFGEIIDFCSLPDRDMNDSRIQLCKTIQSSIKHGMCKVDYSALFSREIQIGRTIEKSLKDMLAYITRDREFRNFKITDIDMEICWKADCDQARSTFKGKQGSYCSHCYAAHKTKTINREQIRYRLKYLYNHCILKDELEPLKIQITP